MMVSQFYGKTGKNIRKSRRIPKSVRPEEFKALILRIPSKDTQSKVIFLLAYGSGLRVSEVRNLNKMNVREGTIFIEESKYGVERIVPLPKGWRKEFLRYIPFNISIRTMQRRFKKYNRKAKNDERYTFHSLRHGFATRLVESNVPINQVQILLGHSNISTTNTYVKATAKDAIKSYEDLF